MKKTGAEIFGDFSRAHDGAKPAVCSRRVPKVFKFQNEQIGFVHSIRYKGEGVDFSVVLGYGHVEHQREDGKVINFVSFKSHTSHNVNVSPENIVEMRRKFASMYNYFAKMGLPIEGERKETSELLRIKEHMKRMGLNIDGYSGNAHPIEHYDQVNHWFGPTRPLIVSHLPEGQLPSANQPEALSL